MPVKTSASFLSIQAIHSGNPFGAFNRVSYSEGMEAARGSTKSLDLACLRCCPRHCLLFAQVLQCQHGSPRQVGGGTAQAYHVEDAELRG
jgi:hypothetical protein